MNNLGKTIYKTIRILIDLYLAIKNKVFYEYLWWDNEQAFYARTGKDCREVREQKCLPAIYGKFAIGKRLFKFSRPFSGSS
ncbi:hypothetical protein CLOAM0619 [Candidatus Cloacimonas acidaminovorans str. Evry]|uniref:Uncharacterized protein n=1 Tax=Cloacimonas acidaminovorans (strain Evry) TaxID=459349 RepID=B0VGR7_CLOAI|nr:hypothetical protein CLOAM0619 [Candidatus Cloacimonas acidaminovorans str. Evry]